MTLGHALREAEPIATEDGLVILGFPTELKFHKESMEQSDARAIIERALAKLLGAPLAVKSVLTSPDVTKSSTGQALANSAPREVPPIVESALSDIFKAGRSLSREKIQSIL